MRLPLPRRQRAGAGVRADVPALPGEAVTRPLRVFEATGVRRPDLPDDRTGGRGRLCAGQERIYLRVHEGLHGQRTGEWSALEKNSADAKDAHRQSRHQRQKRLDGPRHPPYRRRDAQNHVYADDRGLIYANRERRKQDEKS